MSDFYSLEAALEGYFDRPWRRLPKGLRRRIERDLSHIVGTYIPWSAAGIAVVGNAATGAQGIVAKLWALCNVLRDDGVTYNEYVTELTYLLFLKMMQETKKEDRLPKQYRWAELAKREGLDQLDFYKRLLLDLGTATTKDGLVRAIFTDAQTKLRKPTNLKALTSSIDKLEWYSAREEGLGNLYEGLLEKNASDKKSGAGQYFTPRPLIDCMVRLVRPQAGEIVQDPAAGTAGFLVAADRYIKEHTDDLYKLGERQVFFQRNKAFTGAELVPDTHRLCLMNLLLHGIEGGVELADTLSPDGERLAPTGPVVVRSTRRRGRYSLRAWPRSGRSTHWRRRAASSAATSAALPSRQSG